MHYFAAVFKRKKQYVITLVHKTQGKFGLKPGIKKHFKNQIQSCKV